MNDTEYNDKVVEILPDDIDLEKLALLNIDTSTVNEKISTDTSYFHFQLNRDKVSYMISANNKEELPSRITIPKEYQGLPVTKIKEHGFSDCVLLSIVLFEEPGCIETIGAFAFRGCSELESMELPCSVKRIERGAFYSCSKLSQIYLHSNITPRLNQTAFYKTFPCLTFYVPSKSVRLYRNSKEWSAYKKRIFPLPCKIPSNLGFFRFTLNEDGNSYTVYAKDPYALPLDLIIPSYYKRKPVTVIGERAFFGASIQKLVLPERLIIIGSYAFVVQKLKEVIVPDSVERIENSAFIKTTFRMLDIIWSNSSLERIIFGRHSKLNYIGEFAFSGNVLVKEFIIPKGVNYIGGYAFSAMKLSFIYIPKKVKEIMENPFYLCVDLKEIKVDRNNKHFKDVDGILFNKDGTELVWYPLGKEDAIYTIPDTVNSILGSRQFVICRYIRVLYLKSLQPPAITTSFSPLLEAFKIYVPASAYEDYRNAPGWSQIRHKFYPDDIIHDGFAIENNTLIQYVEDGTAIILPESITEIKNYALTSCANLQYIDVAKNNRNFTSLDGVLFSADLAKLICYPKARMDEEYQIPEEVKTIGFASFHTCNNLIRIKTHKSLEIIEDYAFFRCVGLKELTNIDADDNIKSIGIQAFLECSSIEKIKLISIETIGSAAFALCTGVLEITLGKQIKYMSNVMIFSFEARELQLRVLNIFAVVPPETGGYIFLNIPISIYVPPQSLDLYRSAENWSDYKEVIYPLVERVME